MGKIKTSLVFVVAVIGVSAIVATYIRYAGRDTQEDARASEQQTENQPKRVNLDDSVMKQFDIQVKPAGPGKIQIHKSIPGEIGFNRDRLAHIVPKVSGVVREIRKNIGEPVKADEVLAVIESREVADAKAAYLGACERLSLAEVTYKREETLWQKKISAEQEYLDAKRLFAEAKIEVRSTEQKLHALGFSEESLKALSNVPETSFIRYEITSPIDGTIVEKHIVLGEMLKEDSLPFVVADLSSVWVNLSVHQKDLPYIQTGQEVVVTAGNLQTQGTITYISSELHEETRTAMARVEISNKDRRWHPGLFATGKITIEDVNVGILAPKDAIILLGSQNCIFVKTDKGFEPQAVVLGRANDINVEITSGLREGQEYVTKGAFTLKSELNKPTEEE
jgi:cobalt-zinc-cadmium efflux system membrane fusion protein